MNTQETQNHSGVIDTTRSKAEYSSPQIIDHGSIEVLTQGTRLGILTQRLGRTFQMRSTEEIL